MNIVKEISTAFVNMKRNAKLNHYFTFLAEDIFIYLKNKTSC